MLEDKREQAWREANQVFYGGDSGDFSRPEIEESLALETTWQGWSPLESEAELPVPFRFDELALGVFTPLLENRETRPQ